jgi:hypothetical protein
MLGQMSSALPSYKSPRNSSAIVLNLTDSVVVFLIPRTNSVRMMGQKLSTPSSPSWMRPFKLMNLTYIGDRTSSFK